MTTDARLDAAPPRASRRPSVNDVARVAGVSVGTVSNVLNRPERVATATRDRVRLAIDELGFVRNASARQLRSGELTAVGAVVLDIANPFFTEMARGIEDRLAQDDLTLMLASSDGDARREARHLQLFAEHGVRGVLVTPSDGSIAQLLELNDKGVPVVLLDHTADIPRLGSVSVDDVGGASLAVAHLLDGGHTRIAFLNGPLRLRQCVDRREGVLAALRARGLDPAQVLVDVAMDGLDARSGDAAIRELLARPGPAPTATFCANDLGALGVLRALRELGVAVPQDMAVVGYDDVAFSSMLAPPLTTVRQPIHAIGWTAADLLLRTGDGPAQQVEFAPELIVRESSELPATRS